MKKETTGIVILIVILSIVFCVANWECITKSIGKYIVDFAASKKELPLFGEYVCSELDLSLTFNEHELYVVTSDYKTKVYVDFHGRLLWGDGVIAFYYWDQINNVVEISFGQPPSGVSKDITYIFVSQNRS
jgi:hypothetical protein